MQCASVMRSGTGRTVNTTSTTQLSKRGLQALGGAVDFPGNGTWLTHAHTCGKMRRCVATQSYPRAVTTTLRGAAYTCSCASGDARSGGESTHHRTVMSYIAATSSPFARVEAVTCWLKTLDAAGTTCASSVVGTSTCPMSVRCTVRTHRVEAMYVNR